MNKNGDLYMASGTVGTRLLSLYLFSFIFEPRKTSKNKF